MIDFLVILILILILGSIVLYLVREKKRGAACIGCPYAKKCGGNCSKNCNHKKEQ